MSRYINIATIRIEHNYYNPPVNSFVSLEPTPETKKLMKQRGVMLRQSRGNEWQWIMSDDASGFADKDVLELSMIVKDPCFLQQIESDGYDPDSFYKFNAENGLVEVNDDFVWRKETNGQKLKNEFCRIAMKPVETVSERLRILYTKVEQLGEGREENCVQFEAIKQEIRQLQESCCLKFTIRFCSYAYYWEYLCVFKDENDMRGKDLILRARENIVAFGPPEKCEKTSLGTNVWRLASTGRIKVKERYDITMQLYIGRMLESRFISPPQIGKFQSDSPHTLREVCYIKEQ